MAMQADRFLTLTYRRNETDLDACWKDFTKFVRVVRKAFPQWKYVCVAEFQKRGAVHFHIALRGFQDVVFLRRVWREIVGDGNIDVRHFKAGKKRPAAIAGYIAKYIAKDGETFRPGRYRYRSSEGLMNCISITRFKTLWAGREAAFALIIASGNNVDEYYESDDYPSGCAYGYG